MNLTEYYKYRALAGVGNSSGDGSSDDDSVVIIYDGNIEVSLHGNVYIGAFAPTNEIGTGSIVIELNETKYTTAPAESDPPDTFWEAEVDGAYLGVVVDAQNVYEVYVESDFLLSDDDPQTVTVKITQDQSGSGGGGGSDSGDSDFSIAHVDITSDTSTTVSFAIPIVRDVDLCIEAFYFSEFANDEFEFDIPLYKGEARLHIDFYDQGLYQETTGNITWVPPEDQGEFRISDYFVITGDGTITITDTEPDHDEV